MIGLRFGQRIQWNGQQRDAVGLSWREAAKGLWSPTAYGVFLTAVIWYAEPMALAWTAPLLLGLTLSIPLAVLTASHGFSRFLRRSGLAAIPEDVTPHPLLESVARHESALQSARANEDAPSRRAQVLGQRPKVA